MKSLFQEIFSELVAVDNTDDAPALAMRVAIEESIVPVYALQQASSAGRRMSWGRRTYSFVLMQN